jgi:hypothetical protein
MKRRTAVRLAAVGGVLAAVTGVGVTVANASEVPIPAASAAAGCTAHPQLPRKVGSTIHVGTTFSHCSGTVTLIVQRERWWGWQNVKAVGVPASGSPVIAYNCRGQGTYTYRTLVSGTVGGNPKNWTSGGFRASC